jgi:hypothetical protein
MAVPGGPHLALAYAVTSCTDMSETQSLPWKRGLTPYPGASCVTCLSCMRLGSRGTNPRHDANCKRQRHASKGARWAREIVFTACNAPLNSEHMFKHLGWLLSNTDDEWLALHKNLTKARKRWATVSRVLAREGASPRVLAMFYKVVVQSVPLYGCETLVVGSAQ